MVIPITDAVPPKIVASGLETRFVHQATMTSIVVTIVTPVTSTLAVGTITSHVASIATNPTDNVGSEVALLGTIVLAMSDLATCGIADQYNIQINRRNEVRLTVLTGLVLVVTEGTVQGGQLTELVALELVLTFGNGSSLVDEC